jgi:hypothetical protein
LFFFLRRTCLCFASASGHCHYLVALHLPEPSGAWPSSSHYLNMSLSLSEKHIFGSKD